MRSTRILAIIIITAFSACFSRSASAQQVEVPEGYELVDSVVYKPVATADSTLAGKNIFNVLPDKVNVHQSQQIANSMTSHVASNKSRTMSGYRVRIFFDNKQNARAESEATLKKFKGLFPEVMAYRIYANPYFKVTVGDFRTKSEAMDLLGRIKGAFPSAFVVKENIEYPVVDKDNAVIADTIKVMRPVRK
ncbi:MAG: SPOR domain-containing protein [Bacteroidales bacterium]|nr:SPOR domain-containing protein [Bacteroidales bacterium]